MHSIKFSLVVFISLSIILSCEVKEETLDCTSLEPSLNTYNRNIKSIMDASCATSGCHTQNARAGGITLNTYASVKTNFVNGRGLCSVKQTCNPMPQDGSKLSDDAIQKLECWVSAGAPE
jgi:hypothetical protein